MAKQGRRPVKSVNRPVVVFLLKCLVFWGIALLLVSRVPAIERAGINFTVASLQGALGVIHQHVERHGNAIFAAGASVEIVSDCSPHMPYLIFAAVILAFPSSWKQRLLGLLFGAVVIHVFNVVRIMTLIWVLAWKRQWFDFVHVYLWQTGTILIVFATFALWIRTVSVRPRSA
jgi:exosortase/archaeosortase family protein